MSDLIDTTEMYLRTVYELQEEGVPPLRARIAERLGHSGPTVSQTVARMERDGLIHVAPDRALQLTEQGQAIASRVMRKHRLAECLLVDVLGLSLEQVHAEACRWEHVMSETVERRLVQVLGHPQQSPFGNPIPGLDELGEPAGASRVGEPDAPRESGLTSLASLLEGAAIAVVVRRIGEQAQDDPVAMTLLTRAAAMPGSLLNASRHGGVVRVWAGADGDPVDVPQAIAAHVFVASSEAPLEASRP